MKTSLSHLPESKQREILEIVEIIKEVLAPEMIILFGSYAKGKQVNHKYVSEGVTYEYISDYDFLVVLNDSPEKIYIQENIILNKTDKFETPVNLEIHGIDYINKGLEVGEYFFTDIIKEGIVLYDTERLRFVIPRELTTEEKKEKAQRYFNHWYNKAKTSFEGANFYLHRKHLNDSAFALHQVAESLYYATLLVFTDYKPKLHNLWKLRKKTKPFSEELFLVFRAETDKKEEHLFELLKQGYIDARYRSDYVITETELQILTERVEQMQSIVEKVCKERIAETK